MKPTLKTRLLVLCGSIFLGFTLLEGVSRFLVYRNTPSGLVFDDDLIFSARPHSTLWGQTLNDIGCIGFDIAGPKQPNEKRIVLLGGSTSYSEHYVESVERTVAALNPSVDVRVVSCAKPRYTSYNNLVNLRDNLVRHQPDVVACYLGINEAIYNAFPFVGDLPDVGYFDYRSFDSSLFATLVKYHLIDKRLRAHPDFEAGSLRSERFLETHLRKIVALGEQHGFRIVLATSAISHPTSDTNLARKIVSEQARMRHFWGNIDSTCHAVKRHNHVMVDLAREKGLALADVSATIPPTSDFFTDICHMTPEGSRLLGQSIGTAIGRLSP